MSDFLPQATAAATAATYYYHTPDDDMARSPSEEPPKPTKRKGNRSVSSLSASQLARKRANDREAQRAIRARTKEHIENLQAEVEELKSGKERDATIQTLRRKIKQLETELAYEKANRGTLPGTPLPREYSGLPEQLAYRPTSEPGGPWGTMPSTASSPGSSTDDFNGYTLQSAPIPDAARFTSTPIQDMRPTSMPYDELENDMGYSCGQTNSMPTAYPPHQQQQPQQCNMPMYSMYYSPAPTH